MRMKRFLLALAAAAVPLFAAAQAYPAKQIHIVVPFPPGGPTDVLGRVLGQSLGETFGQTVVVENKVGAAGNIGVDAIAKAAPDGYTIGIVPAGNVAVNPTLFANLPYKGADLAPVTMLATIDNVLVVNAEAVPARTMKELLDARREEARGAELRVAWRRQPGAPRRRAARTEHGRAAPACAVSRHRAGRQRPGRWPGVDDVRAAADGAAAHQERQAARDRHRQPEAVAAAARSGDDRRAGRHQVRGRVLVRADGAGGNAAPTSSTS